MQFNFTSYILHVYNSPPYISPADTQGGLRQIRGASPLSQRGDLLS